MRFQRDEVVVHFAHAMVGTLGEGKDVDMRKVLVGAKKLCHGEVIIAVGCYIGSGLV